MIQNKISKHVIYLDANSLYGYVMHKFVPANGFKWVDPKEFALNKYINNSSKCCVSEVDFEYPKQLRELQTDYHLALDKVEIQKIMLSN